MAPTPPSGDSPASAGAPGQRHEERIRRNVACISCRDSKVRCRASSVAGQPCQRCAKLQIACVYDKTHKRVTKRSKLELLEQELKTIKEAVGPRNNGESAWSPPTPLANNSMFPQTSTPTNTTTLPPLLPPLKTNMEILVKSPPPAPKFEKSGPTKSRVLGDRVISGEDIEWYFNKFLQCFHPYIPVLRKKDPDEAYQANPVLFWTIIYVASRRYARDEHTFNTLVEHLTRDIWSMLAVPNLDLEAVHAIMFICAWPFPTIRFVTDPSTTLITIAMNACMLMGLHDGLGSHPQFLVGGRLNFLSTDLEASTTWISCCILAQRISTYSGIPPPFMQHNDAHCKQVVQDILSSELMTLFELQKFCNKLHTAMAGHIASHGGVFESVVRSWEDELETLKPLVTRVDTDCSRFFILAAQLEAQSYYLVSPPTSPPPSPINTMRAYTTAQTLITTALTLESTSKFLTHSPNWTYRTIVDAACIVISSLHSTSVPTGLTDDEATVIAQQVSSAVQYCSVREGDLPYRGGVILETFWSVRNFLPKFDGSSRAWAQRIGGAVTFWCLNKFKDALQEAKKGTDGVNRGLEAFHGPAARTNTLQDQPMMGIQDPFQDVDWDSFLDDFGWTGDATVFLGPPQC